MVCGSPSRGSLLVVFVVVAVVFHPAVSSLNVDDGSGVYYERYPLHGPNKPDNEQTKLPTNVSNRNESIGDQSQNNLPDDQGFSVNCTEPTIQDFPPDMFTQEQRQKGYHTLLPSRRENGTVLETFILTAFLFICFDSFRRCPGTLYSVHLHHADDWSCHRRIFRPFARNYRRRYSIQ
jgi:hypothetical protein